MLPVEMLLGRLTTAATAAAVEATLSYLVNALAPEIHSAAFCNAARTREHTPQ